MRLRQIEIFYHVYRTGSISGAARELNVSQPSVSKVLRHAEDQLGFDLFRRSKGRLTATPAAHELFREAEALYKRLASFNRSLENMRERKGGHLRLGVLPSLSLSVGPELAAQLCDDDDDLSLELTTLHSDEIGEALRENRTDLCIGFAPVEQDEITSRKVGSGGFVLVANRNLTEDGTAPDLSLVNDVDFIGLKDSGPLATMVSKALADNAIVPNEIISTHTYHVALSLVRKGAGLAITDQFTAYSHLGGGLHRYPLPEIPQFEVHAAYQTDHPHSDLIDQTMEQLKSVLADLGRGIHSIQANQI